MGNKLDNTKRLERLNSIQEDITKLEYFKTGLEAKQRGGRLSDTTILPFIGVIKSFHFVGMFGSYSTEYLEIPKPILAELVSLVDRHIKELEIELNAGLSE